MSGYVKIKWLKHVHLGHTNIAIITLNQVHLASKETYKSNSN